MRECNRFWSHCKMVKGVCLRDESGGADMFVLGPIWCHSVQGRSPGTHFRQIRLYRSCLAKHDVANGEPFFRLAFTGLILSSRGNSVRALRIFISTVIPSEKCYKCGRQACCETKYHSLSIRTPITRSLRRITLDRNNAVRSVQPGCGNPLLLHTDHAGLYLRTLQTAQISITSSLALTGPRMSQ